MEDALVLVVMSDKMTEHLLVLILVLMEDALVRNENLQTEKKEILS